MASEQIKLRRIRIVGDGSSRNTKVFDCETGEQLPFVREIKFTINSNQISAIAEMTTIVKVEKLDVGAAVLSEQKDFLEEGWTDVPASAGDVIGKGV